MTRKMILTWDENDSIDGIKPDLPSAEDLTLLGDIDAFNSKVRTAISYLSERGYSQLLIEALLRCLSYVGREGFAPRRRNSPTPN